VYRCLHRWKVTKFVASINDCAGVLRELEVRVASSGHAVARNLFRAINRNALSPAHQSHLSGCSATRRRGAFSSCEMGVEMGGFLLASTMYRMLSSPAPFCTTLEPESFFHTWLSIASSFLQLGFEASRCGGFLDDNKSAFEVRASSQHCIRQSLG